MYDSVIVDAHQHFWDLQQNYHPWLCDTPMIPFRYGDYSTLRRNYLPDDYFSDSLNHRIVKTVYVETEWNPADPIGETRWIHSIHERFGVPNAVVVQAWLDRDDVDQVLASQAGFQLVRSVRHKPRAAASASEVKQGAAGSMSDPHWRAGYALLADHGLSFDLQVPYWHLYEAAELAADFPDTRIILNHTGLPADRSDSGINAWRAALQVFAQAPNVAIKLSGLGLRGQPWRLEDNRPIVLDAIEIFGIDRCMFASNFPVDSLVVSFDELFSLFKIMVQAFSEEEQKKIFYDNAIKIYRI
jgi:predicted TIM-barrel fold metal-dependent hydrolase